SDHAERLHAWFTAEIVERYDERVTETWTWDHSGEDDYLASIAEQREQWRQVLNPPRFDPIAEPVLSTTAVPDGQWLEVPVHQHLSAAGLLVVPPGASRLVVFQHGLGSWPEKVFGVPDADNGYHGIGTDLVGRGYAVLAPM